MTDERDELLPADLVAQAQAMWNSTFWQRVARYCRERRDALVSAVDPPANERGIWLREGQLVELNRFLRGDAFLLEVVADAQKRRNAQAAAPEEEPPPPWMRLVAPGSEPVN